MVDVIIYGTKQCLHSLSVSLSSLINHKLTHLTVIGFRADDLFQPELHLGKVGRQRQQRRVQLLLLLLQVTEFFQLWVGARNRRLQVNVTSNAGVTWWSTWQV